MVSGAKYSMLYPPLVRRIYEEELRKVGAKDCEKAVKTKLHQMFGAYVQGNAHKKAAALLRHCEEGSCLTKQSTDSDKELPVDCFVAYAPRNDIRKILSLHASTKERLPTIEAFWAFICKHIGEVETVLDLGCGFNPFSIPFIPGGKLQTYYAYDIDTRTRDLLNRFFAFLGLPQAAACADLAVETPQDTADLALLCKLVPVLEAQRPGRGFELVRQTNAKFVAITYPLQSLGGRNKGMGKNYAAQFERAASDGLLGEYSLVESAEVGNELVYLLSWR